MGNAAQPTPPEPDPKVAPHTSSSLVRRPTPPWVFLLAMISVGVTSGHVIALSYLLEVNGVEVKDIAALSALTFVPHSWKFLWTPVLDTWMRRRSWYLWTSLASAVGTLAAFLIPMHGHHALLSAVLLLVNIAAATSNSALGALCATTVLPEHKGVAAGYFSTGSLASTGLANAFIVLLARPPALLSPWLHPVPLPTIGILVAAIMVVSSLSILLIDEAPPLREPLWPLLKAVLGNTVATVRSRIGWTGLLICLSPVGTAAAANLFGALAPDYHATSGDVAMATGLVFGLSNALGAFIGGYLADRINRRMTYLLSGVLTAACAFGMALSAPTRYSYIGWILAYGIASGLAYAAFYAFVFEMIDDGPGATTKFGLFIGVSNLAISYVTFLDGVMYKQGGRLHLSGAAGLLTCDGALNILGVALIGGLMVILRRQARREAALPPRSSKPTAPVAAAG